MGDQHLSEQIIVFITQYIIFNVSLGILKSNNN